MFDEQISGEADQLICILYKAYFEKRYLGMDEIEAKCFGNHEMIHEKYVPRWDKIDVIKVLSELKINGYIDANLYDGNFIYVTLSDNAIIYMKKRLKTGLAEVADFVFNTTV